MPAVAQSLAIPVGAIRRFGPWGPEYEVLGSADPESGRCMVKIVLVRTGEELNYPLESILLDPEA